MVSQAMLQAGRTMQHGLGGTIGGAPGGVLHLALLHSKTSVTRLTTSLSPLSASAETSAEQVELWSAIAYPGLLKLQGKFLLVGLAALH